MPDSSKGYLALTLSLTVFQSLLTSACLGMIHGVHTPQECKLEETWCDFKTGNHMHLLGVQPCQHCRLLFHGIGQPALPVSLIINHEITPAT
jgi:hypothetical protein